MDEEFEDNHKFDEFPPLPPEFTVFESSPTPCVDIDVEPDPNDPLGFGSTSISTHGVGEDSNNGNSGGRGGEFIKLLVVLEFLIHFFFERTCGRLVAIVN